MEGLWNYGSKDATCISYNNFHLANSAQEAECSDIMSYRGFQEPQGKR